MGMCWIMPKQGKAHKRDVLPHDENELLDHGFQKFRVQRKGPGGEIDTTAIFSNRSLKDGISVNEWIEGVDALYGNSTSVEVFKPDGSSLLSN